jgi:hypothetical protein
MVAKELLPNLLAVTRILAYSSYPMAVTPWSVIPEFRRQRQDNHSSKPA